MSENTNNTQIEHFREILFWPFFFEANADSCFKEIVAKGGWQKEPDWQQRNYHNQGAGGKREPGTAYGEFVYFQPYVQRFLYGNSAMKVWRRDDLARMELVLTRLGENNTLARQAPIACTIEQLWLFQFRVGSGQVGMLAIELQAETALALQDVENFLDQARRVYPPYFEKVGKEEYAKRFPLEVTFTQCDGRTQKFGPIDRNNLLQTVQSKRLPLAPHWRWLLDCGGSKKLETCLRHIEDERAPSMAFLALKDPRQLTRGDFIRLCFADDSGASESYPYSAAILQDFETRYCYDRFWVAQPQQQNGSDWMKCRILNCGYAFTYCGCLDDTIFYMEPTSGGLSHFRNHYFMIGLITHFQRAALLLLSDRLSSVVDNSNEKQLRREASATLEQFINFTDRYWFEDISTQLQPQELYLQWRGHLKLESLFQQVREEAHLLTSYLDTRAAQQEAGFVKGLTVIGVVWGLLSLLHDYGLGRWFEQAGLLPECSLLVLAGLAIPTTIAVWFLVPSAARGIRKLFIRRKA